MTKLFHCQEKGYSAAHGRTASAETVSWPRKGLACCTWEDSKCINCFMAQKRAVLLHMGGQQVQKLFHGPEKGCPAAHGRTANAETVSNTAIMHYAAQL